MKYYLVSYAYKNGFGRKLFGRTNPVDESCIFYWESLCGEAVGSSDVCIIAITSIDGPVTTRMAIKEASNV